MMALRDAELTPVPATRIIVPAEQHPPMACAVVGVRIASEFRSVGIGRELFQCATQRARHRGCRMLQLTTDKARTDALRYHESPGFTASHEGMKLHLRNVGHA